MLTLEKANVQLDGFALSADLQVAQGSFVAVLGPSGAGKSTLLGAIAGFQDLTSGRITWGGRDITDTHPSMRPVSMLFQDNNLFPHLTVAQNVGLGLRTDLRLSSDDKRRVDQALARVGLQGLSDRKPGQLSGGQIARVALARVLLRAKPILLLDEPFGALGPALKSEMLALVRALAQETDATVLMVSHEPKDASAIADQVILVADGIAHAPRATQDIFDDPPAALVTYLG